MSYSRLTIKTSYFKNTFRRKLIEEIHGGVLVVHFGIQKTN